MRAWVYERYGPPEEVLLERELPVPEPGPHDLQVRVHATGLNSWDWDLAIGSTQGRLFGWFRPKWPVLGCDVAGVVEAIGPKAADAGGFAVGDRVFADVSPAHWGGLGEVTVAPAALFARIPDGVGFVEAAALPQAGVLALQGLRMHELAPDTRLLLIGAGGGVGTFALQLAREAGVEEIAVVDRASKLPRLRELGATRTIDHEAEDACLRPERYDFVLDIVGKERPGRTRQLLAPGGLHALCGGTTPNLFRVLGRMLTTNLVSDRTHKLVMHMPNAGDLAALAAKLDAGTLKPEIGEVVPFGEAPAALARLGRGEVWGKVVVQLG